MRTKKPKMPMRGKPQKGMGMPGMADGAKPPMKPGWMGMKKGKRKGMT